MADECDMAQAREEMDRNLAIMASRRLMLVATGDCHNCGASVPDGHRFCDADCLGDWDRRDGMRRTCGR